VQVLAQEKAIEIPNSLGSSDDQVTKIFSDISQNDVHNDESLDLSTDIKPINFEKHRSVSKNAESIVNNQPFNEIPQPSQVEFIFVKVISLLIPNSICHTNFLKDFHIFTNKYFKNFQDEDNVFDEMLEQNLELRRDMFCEYDW
jgi:hypothetical protein